MPIPENKVSKEGEGENGQAGFVDTQEKGIRSGDQIQSSPQHVKYHVSVPVPHRRWEQGDM